MDITTQIPSGSPNGELTTKAEAAIRVAKAVAARETRGAAEKPGGDDGGGDDGKGAEARNSQPGEAFGAAILRAGAPEFKLPTQARLELDIDPATERVIGRVVNKETGEVIIQVPSETVLRLVEAAEKSLGNLVDQKL